jgi:hypothetical protein
VSAGYYGPRGPYGTEREVTDAIGLAQWDAGDYTECNAARLSEATTAAGVELGPYDQRILRWLAGWEPQTVEVIAALIERAAQRGKGET